MRAVVGAAAVGAASTSTALCAIAACCSRCVHNLSNAAASIHVPSQLAHSSRSTSPTRIQCMSPRQAGHFVECGCASSARLRAAPHDGQNAAPWKSSAMQTGHPIVARRAWQYRQRPASGAAGAPQLGQRRVETAALTADKSDGGSTSWV